MLHPFRQWGRKFETRLRHVCRFALSLHSVVLCSGGLAMERSTVQRGPIKCFDYQINLLGMITERSQDTSRS